MELPPERYYKYLESRRTDLSTLRIALAAKRIHEFTIIGHQIKGNAANFNFDELTYIGERMEKMNPQEFESVGITLINDFAKWIEKTQLRLDQH